MFTGIVEETGRLRELEKHPRGRRLTIDARIACENLEVGDSIAVDGCCLTAVEFSEHSIQFDVLEESVRVTRIGTLREGDLVNLERSLRYQGKIGGHFVSGHVDAVGEVRAVDAEGADTRLRIAVPSEFMRYLVYKGSVAINGVSLTVAEVDSEGFAVWLIPHTLENTNLRDLAAGSPVNLEFDLLGKYVERIFPGQRAIERTSSGSIEG